MSGPNVLWRLKWVLGSFISFGALMLLFCVAPISAKAASNSLPDGVRVDSIMSALEIVSESSVLEPESVVPEEGTVIENGDNIVKKDQNLQTTDYTCGPSALAYWLSGLGISATEAELATLALTDQSSGTNFYNLLQTAKSKGASGAKVVKAEINANYFPALAFLKMEGTTAGHYVVIKSFNNGLFLAFDPASGDIEIDANSLIESGSYFMINSPEIIAKPVVDEVSDTIVTPSTTNNIESVSANSVGDEELKEANGKFIPILAAIGAFTAHGLNQLINRGISPSMVLNTLRNPQAILVSLSRYGMQLKVIGSQAVIVINQFGQVITAWRK